MVIELFGNVVEIEIGSSTGNPDYKGIQTCDLREWVRLNAGSWYLIKYPPLDNLDAIETEDLLALKLSTATGVDVYDYMGKLYLGHYETGCQRKLIC